MKVAQTRSCSVVVWENMRWEKNKIPFRGVNKTQHPWSRVEVGACVCGRKRAMGKGWLVSSPERPSHRPSRLSEDKLQSSHFIVIIYMQERVEWRSSSEGNWEGQQAQD
jgi:hypothetical protein